MENREILTIVGVVIVVAVIASLVTVNLTGNTIKQMNNPFGKYQIYTKQEVDAKFLELNVGIDSETLEMLNQRCEVISEDTFPSDKSCNELCLSELTYGETVCISAGASYGINDPNRGFYTNFIVLSCNELPRNNSWISHNLDKITDINPVCTCCH